MHCACARTLGYTVCRAHACPGPPSAAPYCVRHNTSHLALRATILYDAALGAYHLNTMACRAVRRYLHVPLSSRARLRGTARENTRFLRQHTPRGYRRSLTERRPSLASGGQEKRKTVHCGLQQTTACTSFGQGDSHNSPKGSHLTQAATSTLPRSQAFPQKEGQHAPRLSRIQRAPETARGRNHTSREAKPRSESQGLSFTGPREMAQSLRLPGPDKWSRPTREDNSPVYSTKPA